MTNKELILDCLIQDDEAFTQIVEYFELDVEVKISPLKIKTLLDEMIKEGYISINYTWQNEHNEYPYSLTEKGKIAWENIQQNAKDKTNMKINIFNYETTKEQSKSRLKNGWLLICKIPLIIEILFICLSVYLLLVGIIANVREALIMGVESFFVCLFLALYLSRCYQILKTRIIGNFNFFNNGSKKYELNKDGDVYEAVDLTDGTNFKFAKSQIKSVKKRKDTMVIILKPRAYIVLPNIPEAAAEFLYKK